MLTNLDADFEEFWRLFPKRPGNPKQPALLAWKRAARAKELPAADDMRKALAAYTKHCMDTKIINTAFVAHGSTFINQRRWNDWTPAQEAVRQPNAAVLPTGYEDQARALIAVIGARKYQDWFGMAKWSNGGEVLRIQVGSRFERDRIEADFLDILERVTKKDVRVELAI